MAFERVRRLRVSVVASRLNLSARTVLRLYAEGVLRGAPANPGRRNSPVLIEEPSIEAFERRREEGSCATCAK